MKIRLVALALSLCFGLSCSNSSNPLVSPTAPRSYSGTASVGDFLSITLDPASLTFSYKNLSNGDTGSDIPYVINADGTDTLQDPQGNLIAAYEVPGFGLLVEAAKAGPLHNSPALVTAVAKGTSISTTSWANQSFNYMQFRTAAGGLEVGSVVMDSQGDVTHESYWPYGATSGGPPFNGGQFLSSFFIPDPSGAFMTMSNGDETDYVFGTPNGVFAVDTANGAIIGLKKASTKAFNPTAAGTYKAIYYQKTGATTGAGNVETGTPSLANATIIVGSTGQITIQDKTGATIVQTALTPVADTPYLFGSANELTDPCFGLFTFRIASASKQQDVFVTFVDHAMLFASFTELLPPSGSNPYDYLYGVGLK